MCDFFDKQIRSTGMVLSKKRMFNNREEVKLHDTDVGSWQGWVSEFVELPICLFLFPQYNESYNKGRTLRSLRRGEKVQNGHLGNQDRAWTRQI